MNSLSTWKKKLNAPCVLIFNIFSAFFHFINFKRTLLKILCIYLLILQTVKKRKTGAKLNFYYKFAMLIYFITILKILINQHTKTDASIFYCIYPNYPLNITENFGQI